MKRVFSNLKISNKLAVIFITLLVMMGVGGSVGLYNAVQIANVTELLYVEFFKRTATLRSIENELLSQRQELFLHTIITEGSSKTFLEGSIGKHRNRIKRLIDEYKSLGINEKSKEAFDDLVRNLERYWAVQDRVEVLSVKGEKEKAMALIRTEVSKEFTRTLNSLKKLISEETSASYLAYQKSNYLSKIIILVTLAFTILAIITAGGLWLTLARSIVRPIVAIEESAKRIGQGDLKQRVPIMTNDEIGDLAIEFNKMVTSLENYYATLNKKVEERTEELRLANEELSRKKQELESANLELKEANKLKSQFLANVSHELRTPLNSIIGFSELLKEKAFGELNEKQLQYVNHIHSSGDHLLQLINNILDLSRIDAGKMEVIMEEFPISEAIGETLGSIRPLAHEKNITIETKSVPASPVIKADKVKFKQIMINLLSNAVKFNVDGGKVYVDWEIVEEPRGSRMERFLILRVKDTGIGIRKEDMGRLFKEFEQIDPSITREYGGTGLGLALTKRLVELHNGSIWAESEVGKGSVFTVKLPIPQDAEEVEMPELIPHVSIPDKNTRPVVLIGSESQDLNHLLEIYLAGDNYEVITASDGVELLRKARTELPFTIIMGISIPKKDGWDVLRDLKSNAETKDIPVVIITSSDNRDLAMSYGAVAYMKKPVNRQSLLRVLERIKHHYREKNA